MNVFYADSSVLVKRHIQERGSAWVQTLVLAENENVLVTAQISTVEIFSALNRRCREGSLMRADYIRIADDFSAVCESEYKIIVLANDVIAESQRLLETYPLRAYDAVQLASAVVAQQVFERGGALKLIFLSADERLLDAAKAEGLAVDNPNWHA